LSRVVHQLVRDGAQLYLRSGLKLSTGEFIRKQAALERGVNYGSLVSLMLMQEDDVNERADKVLMETRGAGKHEVLRGKQANG
jgi:hypothetical protein